MGWREGRGVDVWVFRGGCFLGRGMGCHRYLRKGICGAFERYEVVFVVFVVVGSWWRIVVFVLGIVFWNGR